MAVVDPLYPWERQIYNQSYRNGSVSWPGPAEIDNVLLSEYDDQQSPEGVLIDMLRLVMQEGVLGREYQAVKIKRDIASVPYELKRRYFVHRVNNAQRKVAKQARSSSNSARTTAGGSAASMPEIQSYNQILNLAAKESAAKHQTRQEQTRSARASLSNATPGSHGSRESKSTEPDRPSKAPPINTEAGKGKAPQGAPLPIASGSQSTRPPLTKEEHQARMRGHMSSRAEEIRAKERADKETSEAARAQIDQRRKSQSAETRGSHGGNSTSTQPVNTHNKKDREPRGALSAAANPVDSRSKNGNGSQAKDFAMANQASTRHAGPTAGGMASVPGSSGSVPGGTGDSGQRPIPKLILRRQQPPPATNTAPAIPPTKNAQNPRDSMGSVSGGLTNASGSTMQPGSRPLATAQHGKRPDVVAPQNYLGSQSTASTSTRVGGGSAPSRHVFEKFKKQAQRQVYSSTAPSAQAGPSFPAPQRKSPTVSVSTPYQAQMATSQGVTQPGNDVHVGSDTVMGNTTGMRREEKAPAEAATLKGNATKSDQPSTAGQGKQVTIKIEPGLNPTGDLPAPMTHVKGMENKKSQGAGSAVPSAADAIVKIEDEDGSLIQVISGLDENLSKKLEQFRRSDLATRDAKILSSLWKQATWTRNKAEVALLIDSAITAVATVRGKQAQQKAAVEARPVPSTMKEVRKRDIAKNQKIIDEADQWMRTFQEMKAYLKGP